MLSGPGLLQPHPPMVSALLPPPWAPGLCVTTITGIELIEATIVMTVLAFGGWDRYRDIIKLPIVAGIGLFGVTFSLTLASFMQGNFPSQSYLNHGISSWHIILICKTRFAPEQNPPPKSQRKRRRRVSIQCSASAPERRPYHSHHPTGEGGDKEAERPGAQARPQ